LAGAQKKAKERALRLLAEARTLQNQGKLIEARQKALDAQAAGAAFGPDEVKPEAVLMELGSLCDKRVANLLQLATDCAAGGATDPAQFRKAADYLAQARKHSEAFGFDTRPVETKMAWLEQARESVLGKAAAAPGGDPGQGVTLAAAHGPDPVNGPSSKEEGLALLDKARLELRSGQTAQARKLAVAAFTGPYGVQPEAEKMLRSIDQEEFNQTILAANRAAEAGFAAFNRHDYAHAARIFDAIDARMLYADKAARFKEIMMTPEMQPDAVARKDARPVVQAKASGPGAKGTPASANPPGKATATDQGEPAKGKDDNSLAEVAAMQEVKFQEMHQAGRQAQRDALARFQAGDTDQALEILRSFLDSLKDCDLEDARAALLRRPIEDRLQRLRALKAQRDFDRQQVARGQSHNDLMRHKSLQEQKRKEAVAEVMKQYNALYKEGKYKEALVQAQKALELDPDNVAASAAVMITRNQVRVKDYEQISKEKEEFDLRALNDADRTGPWPGDSFVKFNKDLSRENRKRKDSLSIWSQRRSPKERQIERQLSMPVSLNFQDTKLSQAIEDLKEMSGVNVVPDTSALEEAGISLDRPLSLKVENISLKSALNLLLQQIHLTHVIKDEVLLITTEDNAKGKLKRVTYPVADLVVPVENHPLPNVFNINYYLERHYQNGLQQNPGPTPYTGPFSMQTGAATGTPSSGGLGFGSTPTPATTPPRAPGSTNEEALIKLITSTIAPQSWSDVGGQGTVQYFPLGLALVINQTLDIQEQVQDLLAALRRLQDLEVAVEMRMVSVSESFFERIGLDFNVNIVHENTKYDNNLLTTNFQPFGFINTFKPSGFVSGITPAGTFTPDLGIPLRQDSFALTTPPFGNYPGLITGDGGLTLGLAFLSDIQVFMFMEAAQGDRRFNVMQAPKLTMFNGQTATLTVTDTQFFLTGIAPAFTPSGQLYFTPMEFPAPLGVALTVQPVVSADRRFVRMNLAPTLTNLANANVPVIPIQIPVPQVFETGIAATGQDRLFQVFLQMPTMTTIAIMTTVSVPDGGTVLLGGLKTLSEGRLEYGPPILSKIPYINRLFKNVGYGRDAQSLLIMVTPRIIINAEEEERQVGLPEGGGG
jgi:type II secretory pathway component GspD/PulD (secretin)